MHEDSVAAAALLPSSFAPSGRITHEIMGCHTHTPAGVLPSHIDAASKVAKKHAGHDHVFWPVCPGKSRCKM